VEAQDAASGFSGLSGGEIMDPIITLIVAGAGAALCLSFMG